MYKSLTKFILIIISCILFSTQNIAARSGSSYDAVTTSIAPGTWNGGTDTNGAGISVSGEQF
jgi:hypothetical protein